MESLTEEQKERILKNKTAALEIQNRLKESKSISNDDLVCTSAAINLVDDTKKEVLKCLQMVLCQDFNRNDDNEARLHLTDSLSTTNASFRVCANLLQSENEILLYTSFNEQCCKYCQMRLRPDFETICKATVSSEYLLPEVGTATTRLLNMSMCINIYISINFTVLRGQLK